jgi:hypothetical protein
VIIKFPGRRRHRTQRSRPREPRIKQGLRMRDAAFRSSKVILESPEADLVRNIALEPDEGASKARPRQEGPADCAGEGRGISRLSSSSWPRRSRPQRHRPHVITLDEWQASGSTREPDPAIYSYDERNRRWVLKEGVR